jgi:Domain of unknown function (DUF4105)
VRRARAVLALLCMTALGPRASGAQQPPANTLQVFLVTLGEGKYYWEKFGHNALWFYDPARGVDLAYNWGTFDFAEPGFLGRLLTGRNRYWVDTVSSTLFFDYYRYYDRSITVQRLNLSPEQATRALEFSRWNSREENKFYQYDYFGDNCSTRVRDVIDRALGGALKRATATARTDHTYRRESVRLVDDMKLTQFGINAALGQPSDVPLSVWEDMFAPARMQQALANLTVPGPDGAPVRVVAEERVLYESQRHAERATTPSLVLPYLIAGVLIAAAILAPGMLGERARGWEILFRVESTVWAASTGILGLVILLAWLITAHVYWFRNENLLLFNPLALFLAVLIPLSGRSRWRRPAAICAIVLAMLAALALVLKGIPVFRQENLAMIFLVLPAQFAVAYALWSRARSTVASPATS